MKKPISILLIIFLGIASHAQLTSTVSCPDFNINILDGRINVVTPAYTVDQIKGQFPCYSSAEQESDSATCGGGVFFKDRDLYFYTRRNYVEIGPKFKGKLSLPLMGAPRTGLFKWLGNPAIKEAGWDAFTTSYGILILYYDKAGKVNKIRFSTESAATIKLCQ